MGRCGSMWVGLGIVRLCIAQQGLLGSPQYANFGQGQCPIARANAGSGQLAARHTHNGACTAGMGMNEFQVGNDRFITRHQDYILAFRNGSCISSAPENTTCDSLHLYRRERTPFLVILEAFWRRTNGTVIDGLSTRHQTPYSTVSEMDRNSRYVAATMDFGPHENFQKMPLSKVIDGDTYYFFYRMVANRVQIKATPFRRFDGPNSVQYKIESEDAVMATIYGHNGTAFSRRRTDGDQNEHGFYEPHAYLSTSDDPDVLDGIVLALPLEIIMSNGLENVRNDAVRECGATVADDDPGATFGPLLEDRMWVMPVKPCVSSTNVSFVLSIITAGLCVAVIFGALAYYGLILGLRRAAFPSPSFLWLGAHATLLLFLVAIFSTPSLFSEFGESFGVFSSGVCNVPDDPPFETCNAAYAYRCHLSQGLAVIALLLGLAIVITDLVSLHTADDSERPRSLQAWGVLVYTLTTLLTFSTAVILTHTLFLLYSRPSEEADCGRKFTASPLWGLWGLAAFTFVELSLVIALPIAKPNVCCRADFVSVGTGHKPIFQRLAGSFEFDMW